MPEHTLARVILPPSSTFVDFRFCLFTHRSLSVCTFVHFGLYFIALLAPPLGPAFFLPFLSLYVIFNSLFFLAFHLGIVFSALQLIEAQSPFSEFDDSDGPLKKGFIFHEERKILIAEKFINEQFLLPYPKFSVAIKTELEHLLHVLQSMWDMPTYNCYLNFTNISMNGFDVNWLLSEVQKEVHASESSLQDLHREVGQFLTIPDPSSTSSRPRRALPLAAFAVGAIGLFGSGIATGSDSCGISGIFGTCQGQENADAINRVFTMINSISANLQYLATESDNKFLVIGKELQAIRDLQNQMVEIQNANWHVITQQLETFRHDIHNITSFHTTTDQL